MDENNKKIDEFLEQDMSYGEIADLLGLDLIDVINYENERKGIIEREEKTDESLGIPANRKRKIKKMFLEDGLSPDEIADDLKIDRKQVKEDLTMIGIDPNLSPALRRQLIEREQERKNSTSEDLTKLEKEGKSVFGTRPNIIKRRKTVYELVRKKKTSGEIASELGISIATVENDLVFLRKQGIIENKGTKQEQKEKRQQELIGLYGKVPIEELATKYEVAESTIRDDIKYLIETGQIEDETSEEDKRRRLAIPELRKKFYVSEIAKMFGVSTWTINNDIRWLKKEGLIDETAELRGRRSRKKVEEIEVRRKKVASLYGKKDRKEIASILGVGESTIRKRY